ncbi:multicopper oxidase family protein [Variovorax saccharolyticus]|uniref:multicopper oxidase family protein n=1 Tax=Variovorax saccharolyticus TaxID=3053516 RepID=UPI00257697D5|nr:multicopper oxidase domain-containing protein [Variovorax sp. J22R187]MDM0019120.1 multicopper oxidase domain-containing protein [Variovorax sp. J22R187]
MRKELQQSREPVASRPDGSRRTLLKASIAATAAPLVLTSRNTEAQVVLPPSRATTPWVDVLPAADTPLTALASLTPAPTVAANTAGGECGRAAHQRYAELVPAVVGTPKLYQLTAKENPAWVFNANYPPQPIWGYEGHTPGVVTTPGPTIHARYGESVIVRISNDLPAGHNGFGSPEISTHLHNMHTPSESDGYASDFYRLGVGGATLTQGGTFNDHFYPNIYAGYDEFPATKGDPREALGSLFYHDHTEGVTAPNVLKGLFGRYAIFDDLDTGDETTGLRLPSGAYDYPLSFSDKRFDAAGNLVFDELNPEGVLGDKVVVNGKIEPVLNVQRRRYRFRLLNAGPTRFYEFYLQHQNRTTLYTYTHIANDGNLLPRALINQFRVRLAPAERADIIIDFSRFAPGTQVFLVNQLVQIETRQPTVAQAPGTQLIKFIVGNNPPPPDGSDPALMTSTQKILRPLRDLPTPAEIAALPVRRWLFARNSGNWNINGQFFNATAPMPNPIRKGAAEVWEFVNVDNGWQHPIHVHFEEGRILSRTTNGVTTLPPVHEQGRKDVFILGPLMTMRVLFRFRDFTGKYLMHCHNLTHEDHAMMTRLDIVP